MPEATPASTLPAAVEEVGVARLDKELVLRMLSEGEGARAERLVFSCWDYGGQEVFYALHHLLAL